MVDRGTNRQGDDTAPCCKSPRAGVRCGYSGSASVVTGSFGVGGLVNDPIVVASVVCASRYAVGADGYGRRYRTPTRGGRRGPRRGCRAIWVTRGGGSGGAATMANGVIRPPARPPVTSAGPTNASSVVPVRRRRGRAWSTDTALCRDYGGPPPPTGGTRV